MYVDERPDTNYDPEINEEYISDVIHPFPSHVQTH